MDGKKSVKFEKNININVENEEINPQTKKIIESLMSKYNLSEKEGDPLVNGTIGTLKNGFKTFRDFPFYIKADKHRFDVWQANFVVGEDYFENTEIDYQMLTTGEKCCDWRLAYQLGKLKNKLGEVVPKEFTYAYAITCHKSQGSEWDKVLVLEEQFPFDKTEHARWLYTACTRASEKLVLVR